MWLRKHQNSPQEKSWQSALFAVSYMFKYYTNYFSGDQAALGGLPLQVKYKYFNFFLTSEK